MPVRANIFKLLALCLIATFSYIQGVQLMHAYHHQDDIKHHPAATHLTLKKDINCQVCDYILVKQAQQLPAGIFTLNEVFSSKPILLQRLDLAKPCEIILSNDLNKGPPLV